jgi:hypothetical protein
MKFKTALYRKYKEIQLNSEKYLSFPIENLQTDPFLPVVIAAFAKCLVFNIDITKQRGNEYSFYFLSFLRGLCEDLISLKFISSFKSEDRNKLMIIYHQYLQYSSVNAQQDFFDKEKITQSILRNDDVNLIPALQNELKKFWNEKGYNKDKIFPSVEHMAVDSKLKRLYDFLYHATSRTVHFSPNVLLRTGWFEKNGPITFSPKHFSNYYESFILYHGSYLFIQFAKCFKKELNLEDDIMRPVKELEVILTKAERIPEIVTFEEMNIQRPDEYTFRVLNSIAQMGKVQRQVFLEQLPYMLEDLVKKNRTKDKKLINILKELNDRRLREKENLN